MNEWFVMSIAREVKLGVPEISVHWVPEPVYLIERFDRQTIQGQLTRTHVLDACQILGLDKSFKYQQATPKTLRKILERIRNIAQTRMQLFRWLVFNILVGNNDAHLKNLSFFVRSDAYYLAPHYDLLCTAVYGESAAPWLDAERVWKPDGIRTHAQVTREGVLGLGEGIGVNRLLGNRIIDELTKGVEKAAKELLENRPRHTIAGRCAHAQSGQRHARERRADQRSGAAGERIENTSTAGGNRLRDKGQHAVHLVCSRGPPCWLPQCSVQP